MFFKISRYDYNSHEIIEISTRFYLNSEKTDLIITISVRSSYLNQNGLESTPIPTNPISLTYWKKDQVGENFFGGLSPKFIDLLLVSFVVIHTTNCQ